MKVGTTIQSLAAEIERQLATKVDLKVPSSQMSFATKDGVSSVYVDSPKGTARYGISELAQRQLAAKLQIPFQYFQRCKREQPSLLDDNVNTWLSHDKERRLIRTLDGNVRAVLSERYRRLDHLDVIEAVYPILSSLPGASFESAEMTEQKLYIKVVSSEVTFEVQPGDIIRAGVVVSNSEVGCGSLSVMPLTYRVKGGAAVILPDTGMKKLHVGKTLQSGEDDMVVFKDDTIEADDKAFFLKVRDVVAGCVSQATLTLVGERMRKLLGVKLDDPVDAVEILAQRHPLNEDERKGVLRALVTGGDLSGLGLVHAVSTFSQSVEDYDRATELEVIGGKLLEQSAKEWTTFELPR
jgi:hypothetical protein